MNILYSYKKKEDREQISSFEQICEVLKFQGVGRDSHEEQQPQVSNWP